jgi:ribosomal protein L31
MNIIKKFLNFKKDKFLNRSNSWKKILTNDIELSVHPGFIPNEDTEELVNLAFKKISKLSKKYHLVNNKAELYLKKYDPDPDTINRDLFQKKFLGQRDFYFQDGKKFNLPKKIFTHHIKFRLSDSEDLTPNIPNDIKSEIINDIKIEFEKTSKSISIDEFPDRGYILFDIMIFLDPRV